MLMCPQGSTSSGCSGGLRATGQGTGTAWSREPRIPPSVGTFSELPNLAVAETPRPWCQGLYRSTPLLKNLSLHGFPKQPSVPWKSKGQNPELWPAGPALLLALCKPAGPGAPAGMGKGRVHGLHPRNLVGCMDFKPWWPPRQQRRGEGTLLPFHGRICGCPDAWAFSWGPCAIKVWCFGTE